MRREKARVNLGCWVIIEDIGMNSWFLVCKDSYKSKYDINMCVCVCVCVYT